MVWQFLLHSIPWWAWAIAALAGYLVALYMVGILFGWALARKLAWPVLAVGGALIFLLRARQQGYADRKREDEAVIDKGKQVVEDVTADVRNDTDQQLDRRTTRWEK